MDMLMRVRAEWRTRMRRRSTIERGVRGACSVAAVWVSAAGSREHAFLPHVFKKLMILETNKRHMQLSSLEPRQLCRRRMLLLDLHRRPPPPPGVGRPAITP